MTTATRSQVTNNETAKPSPMNVEEIRKEFPILHQQVNDKPLIYLDNAATAQKPQSVLDALHHYYATDNANIHRGVHTLSARATDAYEQSRRKIQKFINAPRPEEIIFVRGATEGINLIAQTYGRLVLKEGDEILISAMEHHSNIVPWQILCEQTGAKIRVIPFNDKGEISIADYENTFGQKTQIVAITHTSNALGTINPIKEMIEIAHRYNAVVVVDGAQAVPHMSVDVRDLNADFYVFSSHKMFGPTGVGVVYGRYELLEKLPPYQGGGEMIKFVTFEKTTYNDLPHKFEAGTPNIAGVIGLGAAVDYLSRLGMDNIAAYEHELLEYANERLTSLPEIRLIGTAREKAAVISFVVEDVHPHDVGTILDQQGIAVRTGHHCAQPVMECFDIPATVRASMAMYNTRSEIDELVDGLRKVIEVFK